MSNNYLTSNKGIEYLRWQVIKIFIFIYYVYIM